MIVYALSRTLFEFRVPGKFPAIAWRATNYRQATHMFLCYSWVSTRNHLAVSIVPLGDACCST